MPPEPPLSRLLEGALCDLPGGRRLIVAFSGGPDSSALLDALCALPTRPDRLEAWHVNHRVHPEADRWAQLCAGFCRERGVALRVFVVDATPREGESPEEAARRARYAVLAKALAPGDTLCTAHHRDDQVETVLMRLLRGTGPAGLAGMPEARTLGAGQLWRPLLEVPRAVVHHHVRAAGLTPIDDPSNADPRLERGALRQVLLPVMRERWPGADRTLLRSARLAAEAAHLAEYAAAEDLERVRLGQGEAISARGLASLSGSRARSALRRWFRERGLDTPAARHVDEILDHVVRAGVDRAPIVRWRGVEVRRYRDQIHALAARTRADPRLDVAWDLSGPLELPGGRLCAWSTVGRGLRASLLDPSGVRVRLRRGGERIRPVGHGHRRPLKHLFQDAGVAPWDRSEIPLIFVGARLGVVAGLWVEADLAACRTERGVRFQWQATPGVSESF